MMIASLLPLSAPVHGAMHLPGLPSGAAPVAALCVAFAGPAIRISLSCPVLARRLSGAAQSCVYIWSPHE